MGDPKLEASLSSFNTLTRGLRGSEKMSKKNKSNSDSQNSFEAELQLNLCAQWFSILFVWFKWLKWLQLKKYEL